MRNTSCHTATRRVSLVAVLEPEWETSVLFKPQTNGSGLEKKWGRNASAEAFRQGGESRRRRTAVLIGKTCADDHRLTISSGSSKTKVDSNIECAEWHVT